MAAFDGGRLCLNVPLDVSRGGRRPFAADWLARLEAAGWTYQTTIVWNEQNISRRSAWGSWRSPSAPNVIAPVEVVLVLHRGPFERPRPSFVPEVDADAWREWVWGLWTFPGAHRDDHPAPFPEELARRCIGLYSYPGDVVLDPFLGSGTTAAVAARMGRRVYGFDHSPRYVAQARARVAQLGRAA